MAGSYDHIVNKKGKFIRNEKFINQIDNLGDAYEMAEECWHMIQILANGDQDKIAKAKRIMYEQGCGNFKKLDNGSN